MKGLSAFTFNLCKLHLLLGLRLAFVSPISFVPRFLQLFECLVASTAAMVQQNEDAEAELRELSRGGWGRAGVFNRGSGEKLAGASEAPRKWREMNDSSVAL